MFHDGIAVIGLGYIGLPTCAALTRQGLTLKREHEQSWKQVIMAANAPMLCRAAMVEGRQDVGIMSSGQVVGVLDDLPTCAELIERVMAEAGAVLQRWTTADATADAAAGAAVGG